MTSCAGNDSERYEYCSSHLSIYTEVGIIIPVAGLIIIVSVYLFVRFRQRQMKRQAQQTYMATIIPIYNHVEGHRIPYNYSFPPPYPSISEGTFDKPPSYEQTVQEVSETSGVEVSPVPPRTRDQP